jgi:hypothetical protein
MSVTSIQFADRELYLSQIDKITHSHTLRKAESLCKLLRYLADHALTQPGVSLKEYQIATEVFGRPDDFDPQADSAIRVQAGRLRLKLLDYYSHEGLNDPIVVEMPNGFYAVSFHHRETTVLGLAAGPVALTTPARFPTPVEPDRPHRVGRLWIIAVTGLSLALAAALAMVVILAIALNSARSGRLTESIVPAPLRAFWSQFALGPDAPLVIFSNAAFATSFWTITPG